MILNINDFAKVANVQDWNQDEWGAQKGIIPWNYTIEFDPIIINDMLESIRDGREINYDQRTIYVQEWIGNTRIVRPQIIYVQQLLPLPSDPSATT